MILRAMAVAVAMVTGSAAHAFDAWLTAGLDIATAQVPETVVVDGAAFAIERATGADVPQLAKRIEAQWRRQGSEVRPLRQGEWTLRSRMQGAFSEVLQWRSIDQEHELLWSRLHPAAVPAVIPETGLVLPAQCAWGRSVSGTSTGHAYLQRSAHCALSMEVLLATLRASMPTQGWHLRSGNPNGLLLERAGAEGFLSLTPLQGNSAAWLIWLRVEGRAYTP